MKTSRLLFAAAAVSSGLMVEGCFSSCFVRGTRILTPRGPVRIEDLSVGDEVYSLDLENRKPVIRPVARVLRSQANEILQVAAGELVIAGVTAEHPFYDAGRKEWVNAGALTRGTRLVAWLGAADVREIEVTAIHSVPMTKSVEVFNLTIDGPEHDYFAEGLLVHNKDYAYDRDKDGFYEGDDCDDSNASINPDATEICDDGIDNDCNELIDAKDAACGGMGGGGGGGGGTP